MDQTEEQKLQAEVLEDMRREARESYKKKVRSAIEGITKEQFVIKQAQERIGAHQAALKTAAIESVEVDLG